MSPWLWTLLAGLLACAALAWGWLRTLRREARERSETQQTRHRLDALSDELATARGELARLRQAEQRAQQARAASSAKTQFLANMSHELRTPLNAVIGATQLLNSAGDENQAQLVHTIRDSGARLLGLIENVLDLSRIEAGALTLADEDFNLVECVEAAVATAGMQARLKGLVLVCFIDPQLPAWRHGDATRVRQVLLNLLGNAIKFTDRGEVRLRVSAGQDAGVVQLQVSDSGPGIASEQLPHVFDAFRQAHASGARRQGGSGLGLAITQQLVQAMGGQIGVRSVLGQGATFDATLSLPTAREPAPLAPPHSPPGQRLLLVYEPHERSAEALAALLQRLGCAWRRLYGVADLQAALAEARPDTAAPAPPVWLLLAADGEQSLALAEAGIAALGAQQLVVIEGPSPAAPEVERALRSVPRHLHKPVLRSALVSRLALSGSADDDEGSAAVADGAAARRILVVEDDAINQTIACRMLQHAGHRTAVAASGEQALQILAVESFDLVLMDWQMPGLDGLEVTRRLRAGAAGARARQLPVVALTANAFAEDRAACLAAGMDDFLTKPLRADRLQRTVARWLQGRGADDALVAPSDFAALH